ncbi:MAG TPA: hypothetical protein PLX21_09935, partial [Rhodocyclaceae bacterium]|nr:hypothetical protein [Rhodocyclaceae bacterium]
MKRLAYLAPALAALAVLLTAQGAAHAAPAEHPPYRIAMLLYRGCEEACRGFQAYFRQHGIAAEFTLRDAAQDRRRIAGFVQELRREKPDLVVTWGTTVTE